MSATAGEAALRKYVAGEAVNSGEIDAMVGDELVEIVRPDDGSRPYLRVTEKGNAAMGTP